MESRIPSPRGLRSRVVYEFTCTGCSTCHCVKPTNTGSLRVFTNVCLSTKTRIFSNSTVTKIKLLRNRVHLKENTGSLSRAPGFLYCHDLVKRRLCQRRSDKHDNSNLNLYYLGTYLLPLKRNGSEREEGRRLFQIWP